MSTCKHTSASRCFAHIHKEQQQQNFHTCIHMQVLINHNLKKTKNTWHAFVPVFYKVSSVLHGTQEMAADYVPEKLDGLWLQFSMKYTMFFILPIHRC